MPTLYHIPLWVLIMALLGSCADTARPYAAADGFGQATDSGLHAAPLRDLEQAIARGEFPKTTSVLIIRKGQLAYERYFGEGNADLLNDTRSAMKAITALAVGVAIGNRAILSEKARAFSYLGDLRPFAHDTPEKESIELEDMLTMSSALDCNDDNDKSPGNEDNMHPQPDWSRWAVDLPTVPGYTRDAAGLGPWRYCTTNAFLLGQVLQRATGERADLYIDNRLLHPLGITDWQWPYSPAGEPMTGGGLRLKSLDLARIAWMLVDEGRWNGRQIVPRSWVDAAFTAHRDAYAGMKYGYFFWERNYKTASGSVEGWLMAGNGGNAIVMLKHLQAAIVVTRTNYNTHGMHQQTTDMLEHYIVPAISCAGAASTVCPGVTSKAGSSR